MALVLNLNYVDNLDNRCDRIMKVNFRGNRFFDVTVILCLFGFLKFLSDFEKVTKVLRGKDSIYYGEQFQWPMGRKLDAIDTLDMRLYQYSKYLNNK